MRRTGLRKAGLRAAGLVFLAVMALLITLSVRVYEKAFTEAAMVTLRTDRIGNQLDESSEVKARGVVVGEVRRVDTSPTGATITLALEPAKVDKLPEDTAALLIPKTLFGERYVQLSIPEGSTAPPLSDGDVINQDHSESAIELQEVFNELLPVLKAVQPQKLATTLTAMSTALEGRGEKIGNTLVAAANYLTEFNPNLPKLNENIRDLATVSQLYGDIAPDLLDALTDSAVTLNTAVDKHDELDALFARVTSSSGEIATFLRENKENIIRLSATSRDPLEVGARYAPSFPCTLQAMVALKPAVDKMLGAGTGEPGAHVEATVTQSRGGYIPGADAPDYSGAGGPRCYPSGVAPRGGIAPAPLAAEAGGSPLTAAGDGLGLPNSAQERQLISTLVAPEAGLPVSDVPQWSSVLVGPLYRGAEVAIR